MGVFTPFAGIFISGLSGLIAISACKKRNSYALAAVILNIINLIIFSPQMLIMALAPSKGGFLDNTEFKYAFWAILVIQLIGVFLYIKNKKKLVVSNT